MGSPETELLVVGVGAESCIGSLSAAAIEELLENREAGFRVQWWAQVIAWESRQLCFLSWAAIAAAILNYMLTSVTLMFAGHLGDTELAGASLACLGLQGLSYGVMIGMASAVQSVCGQAYGAKRYSVMSIICQRSIVMQLVAALLVTILYWFSGPLLELIGKAESEGTVIGEQAQIFARGLIPQLYAYAVCYPMQRFLMAQNIVNPLVYISVGIFLLHILLTWLVVDVLGYSLLGASLTLSLSWCILTFAIGFYIILSPSCRETWTGFSLKAFNFKGSWPYFRLTIVAAVMMCLEIWYCQILLLISELLPNSTTISVDSISICVTYWNLDSNIMLGMLLAASTRVGNELGAGHPKLAKLSVAVVNAASIIISIVLCAIILIFQVGLIKLYSTDSDVIEAASTLVPLLAISVFINGTHFTIFGVMIGSARQGIMAFVNLVAYYLVGLPIACVLGFKTSLGVSGLYWGLIIGVFLQTSTLSILTVRTNWEAEVEEAINRLKKSPDEDILDLVVNI
ncbi:hypothetical protein L6164_031256 [Bauhinia variegata]|uniref:Uncharacterized protein n=1 Tax=Bauhinia variegata TaxID=167791 RepID=A0ACB9LF85_BAUVA|nr:hypothetical protein L6164_031256 [Bauhinia variegata]